MPAETGTPPAPVVEPLAKWNAAIGAFAKATGKSADDITAALKEVVGEPSDSALEILGDPSAATDDDLKAALAGMKIPVAVLRKSLGLLRVSKPAAAPLEERIAVTSLDILPALPDEKGFMDLLRVGGVLKVDQLAVISAVKAGLASKLDLFNLPGVIKDKMEEFAETQSEPVGEDWVKLQAMVVERGYADVLSVLGIKGNFMNETRKRNFLGKLDTHLWASVHGFSNRLTAWQDAWMKGASNPGAMMAMLMMGQAGARGGVMPPGIMQPPETDVLHDEAEAVIDTINKVFAGTGIPVARALAYDATRITGVLENPTLPAALGYTNRDMMLKGLNIAIGSDLVRLERNISRFVLGIMEFPKITVPNEEYAYLAAMIQLAATIPWEKLEGLSSTPAGIGRRRNGTGGHGDDDEAEDPAYGGRRDRRL